MTGNERPAVIKYLIHANRAGVRCLLGHHTVRVRYVRLNLLDECFPVSFSIRGITGGVVSQPYFEAHFGIFNANGTVNKARP